MRAAHAGCLLAALGAVAGAFATRGALAHHSPARYDMQAMRTVEGTITEYQWGNPHVYLSVRENGNGLVWVVEAFPSTAMKQYGWAANTFVPGDAVIVGGHPGRNPERTVLFLQNIRKAGAATAMYDSAGAVAAAPPAAPQNFRATSLAGTWSTSVGPTFVRFFTPAVAELATPTGAAAIADFRDAEANPGLDCVPFAAPPYMILPGFRSIELRDDTVFIRGEDAAVERVVHLDVASHDGAAPSVQGHSIGRFEGATLVVDTAQFAPHRLGNGAGLPSSEAKHLVERFALNADGGLTYSFELEDAEFLKEPVTGTTQWVYRPDVEFTATPCDRDNAKRFLAE